MLRRSFGLGVVAVGIVAATAPPLGRTIRCRPGTTARRRRRSSTSCHVPPRREAATSCPVPERIATFDNDGTLWCEQPIYVQFALRHRPRQGAGAAASGVEGQAAVQATCSPATWPALAAMGEKGMVEIVAATHAGMTVDEFERIVTDWLATARHPRFKRPYTELVYQPMLELLALPARQRVQDLHRLRRRHRVHAAVDRAGLRHPARAGRRLIGRRQVRAATTASRC